MAKVEMLDKVLAAFEKYIENTVGEYGDSRMFDCGVQEARKVIEQAKKVCSGKKTLTGVPHNDCVRAYKQGRAAAEKGLSIIDNPYLNGTGRYFAAVQGEWNRGWASFSY